MTYKESELNKLHSELLTIVDEIVRVCDNLKIPFFIIGGTAIGAQYYRGFLPWDDDIDLGMLRTDYERFLREAPGLMSTDFFVQHFYTEPQTPFYFAKVRKNGTLFVEEAYKDLSIHHGIFVDIFPFDSVPDNPKVESIHRRFVQYLEGVFKRRQTRSATEESLGRLPKKVRYPLACLWRSALHLVPRRFVFGALTRAQTAFNGKESQFVSIVKMPLDQIEKKCLLHPITLEFEGRKLNGPSDLDRYLHHHYPNLTVPPPIEQQINHAPLVLSFGEMEKQSQQV